MRPGITHLIADAAGGDRAARDAVFALVYDELRALARRQRRPAQAPLSINPTTLVHEAWLKLAAAEGVRFDSSAHFYHLVAQAMRHIVVDIARRRATTRHGGALARVALSDDIAATDRPLEQLVEIDAALVQLAACDAELARVVELHVFAGVELRELAVLDGVSERTMKRRWALARAWLARVLPAA